MTTTTITLPRATVEQALEALETCDAAHPSDGGQQWYDEKLVEPAITALRTALAKKAKPVCKCDLRTRLVGDGCEVCNPKLAAELAQQAEPTRSQQMVAAGFKPRDTRLECDECGRKFTAQMLPIHNCARQAEPPVDDPHRDHWVAIAEAAQKIAASTECGPAEAEALCAALDRLTAAALAQQAEPVEPVAWMYTGIKQDGTEHGPHLVWKPEYMDAMSASKGAKATPLYTAPPQRKPLTEEIEACRQQGYAHAGLSAPFDFGKAARAIERAHNITDPQIADRLARHGIPMPEGDPK